MAELLPEDLAQVLTPAQAADRVKAANGAFIRAQSKGTVPRAIGLEMTNSRQAFADAMARDQKIQQEYGGYDSFAQDIGRNMGNAWDAVKGFAAHTAGIFGDANEMVPGPLQSPIGKNLPTSVEIGEAMGADVDNPGFTIAGLASPLPNELLAVGKLAGPALAAAMAYQKVATKAGGKTPALTRMLDDQRGGPLLHASPFKFDFFDEAHMGRGEGFQAYSPGGFYFSDADLQRGTHPGYLSQFGRHRELGTHVEIGGKDFNVSPNQQGVDNIGQAKEMAALLGGDLSPNEMLMINARVRDYASHLPHGASDPSAMIQKQMIDDFELTLARLEEKEADMVFDLERQQDYLDMHAKGIVEGRPSIQRVRDNIANLEAQLADMQKPGSYHQDSIDIAERTLRAVEQMKISKAEPYSYKIDISDDIKDNLPIYEVPIKDQPAKYRGAVEELARKEFDEPARLAEIDEVQRTIDDYEDMIASAAGKDGTFAQFHRHTEGRLKGALRTEREYLASLQEHLDAGADLDRTYGELVRDLQATHGDEAAQRMLYDAGIPGSRNRTWATRRKLTTPAGAMGQLFGHLGLTDNVDEVYNYAIWDMNTIDEVVRRQTKGGKILEDTAETVYTRSPPKPKKMEADRLQLQWAGSQRYGPLEVLQNPSQQQLGRFRRDIRTDYLAEGLNPNAEPLTRSTQDANGNHWYWRADRGTHYGVEELLKEQKLGDIKLNQNRPGGDK